MKISFQSSFILPTQWPFSQRNEKNGEMHMRFSVSEVYLYKENEKIGRLIQQIICFGALLIAAFIAFAYATMHLSASMDSFDRIGLKVFYMTLVLVCLVLLIVFSFKYTRQKRFVSNLKASFLRIDGDTITGTAFEVPYGTSQSFSFDVSELVSVRCFVNERFNIELSTASQIFRCLRIENVEELSNALSRRMKERNDLTQQEFPARTSAASSENVEAQLQKDAARFDRRKRVELENFKQGLLKKSMLSMGIGTLLIAFLHFSSIVWSILFAVFGEEHDLAHFVEEIKEYAFGKCGRHIVFDSGNAMLRSTEIAMGIVMTIIAIVCFCSLFRDVRQSHYKAALLATTVTYLLYTVCLIFSYAQIDNRDVYHIDPSVLPCIGYTMIAMIMALVSFAIYRNRRKEA